LEDVHVGAADAGISDAHQHVIDADRWFGYIFQPQSLLSAALYQCLHFVDLQFQTTVTRQSVERFIVCLLSKSPPYFRLPAFIQTQREKGMLRAE
jgi:hypothetical protein